MLPYPVVGEHGFVLIGSGCVVLLPVVLGFPYSVHAPPSCVPAGIPGGLDGSLTLPVGNRRQRCRPGLSQNAWPDGPATDDGGSRGWRGWRLAGACCLLPLLTGLLVWFQSLTPDRPARRWMAGQADDVNRSMALWVFGEVCRRSGNCPGWEVVEQDRRGRPLGLLGEPVPVWAALEVRPS